MMVYLVRRYDYHIEICAAYYDKDKAERYAARKNSVERTYQYWVDEIKINDADGGND